MSEYSMNKATRELYAKLAEKRLDSKVAQLKREDSNGITFNLGQLEELETTIYETLFQPLQTLSMIPVSTEYAPGLDTISYRFSTKTGEAETITRSDQVRPDVDESLEKFPQSVIEGGAAYSYDITNLETSAVIDYDHVSAKARASAEAVARWHDRRALVGEAGIFSGWANSGTDNSGNVPVAPLANPDWSTATATQIYEQFAAYLNGVEDAMDGNFAANACQMPIPYFNKLITTRIDSVSGDTIMDVLKRNFPAVSFVKFAALKGVANTPSTTVNRVIAASISPTVVEYRATVVYDEAAPDKKGYRWNVETRGRSGGTVIRYPLAVRYTDLTGL